MEGPRVADPGTEPDNEVLVLGASPALTRLQNSYTVERATLTPQSSFKKRQTK
jgi:hypothetical protein